LSCLACLVLGCSAPNASVGAIPDGGGAPQGDASTAGAAPGRYLTGQSTAGDGACAGISLGDVLAQIDAAQPALADIQTIYDPATAGGDGSFIYPYARPDGGFDVVFKRGLGDCPAGCTENDYLYFSTNATCTPVQVGHFHVGWGAGTCLMIDGAPMWGHPLPPDPLTVCDSDNAPAVLTGTYPLHATGQRTPCAATASKASALDETVTLVIQQDPADPSAGTVTFMGTGHALVDGVALTARFQRRRFDAEESMLDSSCPRGGSVTARYDFEGFQPGGIEVTELADDTCAPCKGSMSLTLTP
jgi:hypothetical protein